MCRNIEILLHHPVGPVQSWFYSVDFVLECGVGSAPRRSTALGVGVPDTL